MKFPWTVQWDSSLTGTREGMPLPKAYNKVWTIFIYSFTIHCFWNLIFKKSKFSYTKGAKEREINKSFQTISSLKIS